LRYRVAVYADFIIYADAAPILHADALFLDTFLANYYSRHAISSPRLMREPPPRYFTIFATTPRFAAIRATLTIYRRISADTAVFELDAAIFEYNL
jgi:hypothetical protein